MKTAISLPDDIFDGVERGAAALGITRSEFFARAAQRYLDELERQSLTARINAALDAQTRPDDATADLIAYGRRRLAAMDDDW
jgi:metal-responsive CopG/Arc/MetJ family transcriptional regulator